jgi:hypothetical protein
MIKPKQYSNIFLLVLMFLTVSFLWAQNETILRGRVLADIDDGNHETGTSERYHLFIFGVESKGREGERNVTPVLIMYSYSDSILPKSFFNYSKLYELKAHRDPVGDISLEAVALIKIVNSDGKEVEPPISTLTLLDGAPKDILKMDAMLAQYKIHEWGFRIVEKKLGSSAQE